uniref:Uncharacterized protein n=1 Tax=Musca domestica TaxID=7370 RepID=A0A1I8MQH8_MUSDO
MNTSAAENTKVIDLEHLQQLSYERSKLWATFLDNIQESENQCEIPLDHMEDYVGDIPEEEDEDALASMEDENYDDNVDPEALRDITNSTRLSLMVGGTNKSTLLPDSTCNGVNNDLIGMLNETLPVINEHNRQLRESGFDRILNTFDAKKIEEKVGGWLRRHNSLCGGNGGDFSMTTSSERRAEVHGSVKNKRGIEKQHHLPVPCIPFNTYQQEDESDSDASFNSGETARYIKSSRSGNIRNSASTTMMIKTYRMVKSTRQALRDKYGYDPNDLVDSHLNELKLRRRLAKKTASHHHYNDVHHSARSHKMPMYHQYMTPTTHITQSRRKVLRKRTTSNSFSTMDESSSDSDSCYDNGGRNYHRKYKMCCTERYCSRYIPGHLLMPNPTPVTATVKRSQYRSHRTPICARNDQMLYYYQSHTHSMQSPPSPHEFRKPVVKKSLKRLDNRPCRKESECRCCGQKRLCKEYKHLADTSTEEWIVENSFSPEKESGIFTSTQLTTSGKNSKPIEEKGKDDSSNEVDISQQDYNHQTIVDLKSSKKVGETPKPAPVEEEKSHSREMQLQKKSGGKCVDKNEDETSDLKANENKSSNKTEDDPKQKPRQNVSKNVTKKKTKSKKELNVPNDSFQLELQIALKESEELYKKEQMRNVKGQPQEANVEIDLDDPKTNAEETYTDFKVVYNSTTVAKNKADEAAIPKGSSVKKTKANKKDLSKNGVPEAPLKEMDMEKCDSISKSNANISKAKERKTKMNNNKKDKASEGNDKEKNPNVIEIANSHKIPKSSEGTEQLQENSMRDQAATKVHISITVEEKEAVDQECDEDKKTTISSFQNHQINDFKVVENSKFHSTEGKGENNRKRTKNLSLSKPKSKCKAAHLNEVIFENKESQRGRDIETNNDTNISRLVETRHQLENNTSNEIPLKKPDSKTKVKEKTNKNNVDPSVAKKRQKRKKENSKSVKSSHKSSPTQSPNTSDDEIPAKLKQNDETITHNKKKDNSSNNNSSSNNANVTSTTMQHSPSPEIEYKSRYRRKAPKDSNSDKNDDIDCTVVSSTTANLEPPAYEEITNEQSQRGESNSSSNATIMEQNIPTNYYTPNKGILIYAPHKSSLAPPQSFSQDGASFIITHEHLSRVIGQKAATKFLKYYIGRRRFNSKSTIYFKPPSNGIVPDTSEDSSSDDDDLEYIGQYGDLYESFGGGGAGSNHDSGAHKQS